MCFFSVAPSVVEKLTLNRLWEGVAIVAIYMLYIQIVAPVPQILGAMREIESQNERMKVRPHQSPDASTRRRLCLKRY